MTPVKAIVAAGQVIVDVVTALVPLLRRKRRSQLVPAVKVDKVPSAASVIEKSGKRRDL